MIVRVFLCDFSQLSASIIQFLFKFVLLFNWILLQLFQENLPLLFQVFYFCLQSLL